MDLQYLEPATVLRLYRQAAHMTQSALAEAVGVTVHTVIAWERRGGHVPRAKWHLVLMALGRSLEPYPGDADFTGPRLDNIPLPPLARAAAQADTAILEAVQALAARLDGPGAKVEAAPRSNSPSDVDMRCAHNGQDMSEHVEALCAQLAALGDKYPRSRTARQMAMLAMRYGHHAWPVTRGGVTLTAREWIDRLEAEIKLYTGR